MRCDVERFRDEVGSIVATFEAGALSGPDAAGCVEAFAQLERLAAVGKTLAARRVADTLSWKGMGDRSAAHWLARRSGSSVGQAVGLLNAEKQVRALPRTEQAWRLGRLSPVQVVEVAEAASADPSAEASLLALAARDSVQALREACAKVKAAAAKDDDERHERVRRSRHLRHHNDAEGAFVLSWRHTAAAGAELLANIADEQDRIFKAARAAGERDPFEAYAADALLAATRRRDAGSDAAARSSGLERRAKVIVRIDHRALLRGDTIDGETCEIAGIGPVPVSWVRDLITQGDAFVAAVITQGADVVNVVHLGRNPTALQRTALEWHGQRCTALGCDRRHDLQIDHRDDWARTRHTTLRELDWLCPPHHQDKTHRNHQLVAGTGRRLFVPPDHPLHPVNIARPPPGQAVAARAGPVATASRAGASPPHRASPAANSRNTRAPNASGHGPTAYDRPLPFAG